MSATLPVIEVASLHKHFLLHLRDAMKLSVLSDVSFSVRAGECLVLNGESGRGKSTLLRCLYGNYGIDGGHAVLHTDAGPVDLAQAGPRQVRALRGGSIDYVSQFLRAVPRVPALDVVARPLVERHERLAALDDLAYESLWREARQAAAAMLARLRLPEALWQLPPATFSGGEQQRVNIARGLLAPPRLLLLDEPTASLDETNRRIVVAMIREIKSRGSAIIGIFHDAAVREALADQTYTL